MQQPVSHLLYKIASSVHKTSCILVQPSRCSHWLEWSKHHHTYTIGCLIASKSHNGQHLVYLYEWRQQTAQTLTTTHLKHLAHPIKRENSIPESTPQDRRWEIGCHVQWKWELQITVNLPWHFPCWGMLKSFDMEARNQWKLSDGHLFERLLPHLTLLAKKFLVGAQSLRSCKTVQASH